MKSFLYLLAFLSFWISSFSLAENDLITTAYNRLFNFKQMCSKLNGGSPRSNSVACNKSNLSEPKKMALFSEEQMEHIIFQEAARIQVNKNKCLIDKLKSVATNQELFNEYAIAVINSALRQKKTELVAKTCDFFNTNVKKNLENRQTPFLIPPSQYDKKIIQELEKNYKEMDELCSDKAKINVYRGSKSLFLYTVPLVSSEELFDLVWENRKGLVSKETQSPLADKDLLSGDLSNMQWIQVSGKSSQKMVAEIGAFLASQIDQREKINRILENSKSKNGVYNLDQNTKDYLYQDGSLTKALKDKNLMDEDLFGIQEGITPQAACLLSKYQPVGWLEITKFAASLGILLAKIPRSYSTLTKIKNFGLYAGKPAAIAWSYNEVFKYISARCSDFGVKDRLKNTTEDSIRGTLSSSENLKSMNYEEWKIPFKKGLKSCNEEEQDNYLLQKDFRITDSQMALCMSEVLFLVLPLKVSLPVIVMQL